MVIKADGSGRTMRGLGTLALKDHVAEAQRIVHEARVEAARVVQAAKDEVARRRREAVEHGYRDGFAKGEATGERDGHDRAYDSSREGFLSEQRSLLSALEDMAATFDTNKDDLLERAKRDALELAVAIAERVIKRAGAVDRSVVVANAEEALGHIDASTDIVIRVNPIDADAMRRYAAGLAEGFACKRHTTIVEDESIEPGGCVLRSSCAHVDATLDGQFNQVADLMLGDRGEENGTSDGGDGS